jgi:MFS family permease
MSSNSARGVLVRTVITSAIGQVLEWYDFFLYGTAAALVFGKLFFPVGTDPLTSTIAAFGGFTVGFVARPIGGVICGHLGDRYGRKSIMVATLVVMGAATMAMGLLPTYRQIGLAAPIALVLLRFLQGLAAGGEWNGSILLIYENSPLHSRGYLSAWSPVGASLGFVLSTAAFLCVQALPSNKFMLWGWRVPFLLSGILIGLGLWLRSAVPENAEFKKETQQATPARAPLIEVLVHYPRRILTIFGCRFGEGGASFIFFTFSITYGKYLGISTAVLLTGLSASMLLLMPVALFAGHVTDLVGRKPVYLLGASSIVVFAYPFFLMLHSGRTWVVMLDLVLANSVVLGILEGAQPAFICELLPVHLRFSGLGIGREISSVLGGGLSPVIATALLAHYRSAGPIAIYLGALGSITALSTFLAPETYPADARTRSRADVENVAA